MNNFLRQFGSFKKNQKDLNEYVDYLGTKYTQDPQTGMWKSNGRSLNEQMLFEEALKSQGGYGGEEGSGGRSQASRANYNIGLAVTEADALAGISQTLTQFVTTGIGNFYTFGESSEFFITATPNNRPVPVYFKFVSSDSIVDIVSSASISFKLPLSTTLNTFVVVDDGVAIANNSISSTFTLPVYDRSTLNNNKCKFIFNSSRQAPGLKEFNIQLINSLNNSVIMEVNIEDELEP